MATSDAFSLPDLTDVDAASGLGDLGPVDLHHPTVDLDGDGVADTATLTSGDSIVIGTDTDLDGTVDELTVVDGSGEFASWQYEVGSDGSAGWTEISHGRVGE
ncbi:hypothetical protein OG921_07605 [Aldersonia sp. NBC_00410]|uniref:DUF6802 family protein n=1 Tax=Aldersonia sp. NBC_00410 TaxID=2975954 RepID=UPI002258F9EF|nr:DUF6802 family protein [Aldersonia sp. NBC_00410]MCX5043033.1 hypothetical protein [Aldersonia sp. NBC_00410]